MSEQAWRGTLRFHDLGMGAWTLELEDGSRRAVFGIRDESLADARVELKGSTFEAMGFGPSGDGPAIRVAHVRAL